MVGLLYNIFVYNYNIGEKSLSFNRIKRLLSNNISEFENNKLNYNYLFQLLNLGIIDKLEENRYSLANTSIITNTRNNYAIGLNLPEELLKINEHLIKKQYLGLTIFESKDIKINDYEIDKMDFNLDVSIGLLNPIKLILKNWEPIDFNDLGQISKMQKYDSLKCKWENVKDTNGNKTLYRFYVHNGNYFKYLFVYNNKNFLIEPYEYDKVSTLKLINTNKSLFKYNVLPGVLKLKTYHNYPVYIYKILLINHIMEAGDFPVNNQFKIEFKQFLKISKKLNLNYLIE